MQGGQRRSKQFKKGFPSASKLLARPLDGLTRADFGGDEISGFAVVRAAVPSKGRVRSTIGGMFDSLDAHLRITTAAIVSSITCWNKDPSFPRRHG